jgi:hypothetical protein
MHMMLWIEGSPSPQTIRDRLLKPDSTFQAALISYLEHCHKGEFATDTLEGLQNSRNSSVAGGPGVQRGLGQGILGVAKNDGTHTRGSPSRMNKI